MITSNKKLTKEIKAIITSTTNAKTLALQELEKIDAKYKALAEKEKAELNKTVKFLDAQLTSFSSLVEEKEAEITDTVYPENNEAEALPTPPEEIVVEEAPATEPIVSNEEVEETVEEATDETLSEEAVTTDATNPFEEQSANTASDDMNDIWPEQPEEWN